MRLLALLYSLTCGRPTYLALLLTILVGLAIPGATAQDKQLLVQNAAENNAFQTTVQLKWYSEFLTYDEGVHIYRSSATGLTWDQLTDEPIKIDDALGSQIMAADSSMELFVRGPKEATVQDLQEGFVYFDILIQSFLDNEYARYLGIYYEDQTATAGNTYRYRAYRLSQGRELLVAESEPIIAGAPEIDELKDFDVFQQDKFMYLDWQPDDERFFAVNIFRTASDSLERKSLTQRPILLSQVEDSLGNMAYPSPKLQDVNVRENIDYTYELEGIGYFGDPVVLSQPITVSLNDVTPPAPPTNFSVKVDSMFLEFSWTNPEARDIKELILYGSQFSEGPFEPWHTTFDGQYYADSVLIPGPYYFYVASVDHAGNEAPSRIEFAEVQDVFPPAPPQGLMISSDTGRLELRWEANTEPDLHGYFIYRTVDDNDQRSYVLLNAEPLSSNAWTQNLPTNVRNEFFYHIVAVDTSYNRSAPSHFATGKMPDVLPPERPFIKQITYDDEHIVVEWIPNVDNDLIGYEIHRSDSTTQLEFQQLNLDLLNPSVFQYTDRDNQPNTGYLYEVYALDSAGNRSLPSRSVFAYRASEEALVPFKIDLSIKVKKRKKTAQLLWKVLPEEASDQLRGFVLYEGTSEANLRPITGLLKDNSYAMQTPEEARVYEVRGYELSGTVVPSKTARIK